MAYRLRLYLDSDTVCLSSQLKGRVTVDVDAAAAALPQPQPLAVRVLVRGVEDCGSGGTVEHLVAVLTVAGPPGPGEMAQRASMEQRIAEYATREGRHNPLPGVAMNTNDDDGYAAGSTQAAYLTADSKLDPPSAGAPQPQPQQPQQPPSPPPAAAAAEAGAKAKATVPPSAWAAGGRYEYPFTVPLPPWLPPSYFYKQRDGAEEVGMCYTASAFLAVTLPTSGEPQSMRDGATTVLVVSVRHPKEPASPSRDAAAEAAAKASAEKPKETSWLTADFTLPTHAARLVRCLPAGQLRRFVVFSAFPRREFLQCVERISIPPSFTQRLVFHLYKNSLTLLGLAKVPFTDVSVKVTYKSSAAVVLTGHAPAMERVRAALGDRDSDSGSGSGAGGHDGDEAESSPSPRRTSVVGGLTVTGTVVGASGDYGTDGPRKQGRPHTGQPVVAKRVEVEAAPPSSDATPPAPAPNDTSTSEGILQLRLKVRAGSVSIPKTHVALMERVRLVGSADSAKCDTYTLASYTYKEKIKANETSSFWVSLHLIPQFRHTARDSDKYPPPAGITTAAVQTTTWLQVTFPDLNAVPEKLLGENVVMVAEDVDLTDTVPFLPSICPVHRTYRARGRA